MNKIFKENKYQIVHSHINSLSVFPLFSAYLAKVPIRIAHSHSTTHKSDRKSNFLKNVLRRFSKLFATNYFACSEHAGEWLFGKKALKEGKIAVIKNAIDVDKFKYDVIMRDKMRKKLGVEDKIVFGHVGRFAKQKNHDFLIDIFFDIYQKRKDIVLLLIGEGPLEEKIKEKVKEKGLDDVVKFLGMKENVNDYMQAMDIFLFPSLYEGLGIVLVEAQCSGMMCLASTEVPKEVELTPNIIFAENRVDIWESLILEHLNYKRESDIRNISLNGYSIKDSVVNLENRYLEFVNNL